MTDTVPTNVATVKPGPKTTEFWVTLIAQISGVFVLFTGLDVSNEAEGAVRASGGAIAALAALGYTISRGLTKKGALTGSPTVGQV